MSIRTVVADNDAGFRAAVVDVLGADPRFTVVGEAADGEELLEVAATADPDLVLVDVRMPSGGAVAAHALTSSTDHTGPSQRPLVVGISADTGPEVVASMLQAGAAGYFAKGRLGASFADLLARVAEGEVVVAVPTGIHALRHLLHQRTAAEPGAAADSAVAQPEGP